MKRWLSILLFVHFVPRCLTGCAAAIEDGDVELVSEALSVTCYDAQVTTEPGHGNFPPWDVESDLAAFCAWNGGFNQSKCKNFHATAGDVYCDCGNGVRARYSQNASDPEEQRAFGGTRTLEVMPSNWDDYIYYDAITLPFDSGSSTIYGYGSIHITKVSGSKWKIHHCVTKCNSASQC